MQADFSTNLVDRCIAELSRGFPVVVDGKLCMLAEMADTAAFSFFKQYANYPKLLLSKARAKILVGEGCPIILNLPGNINKLPDYIMGSVVLTNYTQSKMQAPIDLAILAEKIPALIVGDLKQVGDFVSITKKQINAYAKSVSESLKIICETPIQLEKAPVAKIVSFRSFPSSREHYAIIIGTPSNEPLVRVHSSCYTGDLLASRRCDCGPQLDAAIELMGAGEGGIILYLMQEGRGIGLTNKLRAYNLQQNGKDTVEANNHLGFDDDMRPFDLASKMLALLEITSVKLLTNNPRKIKGLEKAGIKVIRQKHQHGKNEINSDYLATKYKKLGHIE
jgi:GTP cyclohydrolase II